MTIILYYLEYGPPSRAVGMTVQALGLKVEYKHVNMFENQHLTPEYLEISPLNFIPTLIDEDGFQLWESHAIMTYLVSKYGKDDSLYPKDLKKRAIVDQRLHYSNDVFFAMKQACKPLLYYGENKVQPDHVTKIKEVQESVEKLLQGNKFICGDHLTVADFSYVTIMDIMEVFAPSGNKYPLTKAWMELCKSSITDFDKVNAKGSRELIGMLQEKMKK